MQAMHNTNHATPAGGGMHAGHHAAAFKRRFFVCLVLAIPVLILSPFMGIDLPFQITFPGSDWIVLVLATVIFVYGGMPFLTGARDELRQKAPAMMTLISLGITAAYLYSLYAFIMNQFIMPEAHTMDFFWELVTLIVIMLLGHWLEMKAIMGAGDALQRMAELLPSMASVRQPDGTYKDIPLPEVQVGDILAVKAGERIPADGVVQEGSTTANESMVTGESKAVQKAAGDKVIGGSQNGAGTIQIQVTGTGESGYLAQVMQMVASAQSEKSAAETLSDKVARALFYVALAAGILALIVWLLTGRGISYAITRMVTVFVIACPHALGLAVPLVTARSTSIGAKNGLLIRSRKALEDVPKVTRVMMDKTGTLTEGNFQVTKVLSFDARFGEERVLAAMAGMETGSAHPLAAGIVREAQRRGIAPDRAKNVQTIPGVGLTGTVVGLGTAEIVSAKYLDTKGIAYDAAAYDELAGQGYSTSFLVMDGTVAGLIAQGDRVKPEAKMVIEGLKAAGITPMMLTGDAEGAASTVARLLGLQDYQAGLMPEEKERIVQAYQAKGDVVMMVGDGINDAPSLARADVGVAIGAGTDVAMDSADVVLVKSDPSDILHLLSLAKSTSRKMVQNLWWGAGYNILAIPLAAGVLVPLGFVLSPAVGAVMMSLSTVIVAVNALLLRLK